MWFRYWPMATDVRAMFLACVGGGEIMPMGNSRLGSSQVAPATSMDIVLFMKASMRLLSIVLCPTGENPKSLDQMMAIL
jgi:hypothetical protein